MKTAHVTPVPSEEGGSSSSSAEQAPPPPPRPRSFPDPGALLEGLQSGKGSRSLVSCPEGYEPRKVVRTLALFTTAAVLVDMVWDEAQTLISGLKSLRKESP